MEATSVAPAARKRTSRAQIAIDRDIIPLPIAKEDKKYFPTNATYPWDIPVRHSFKVLGTKPETVQHTVSQRHSVSPARYEVRPTQGGVRVWRVR